SVQLLITYVPCSIPTFFSFFSSLRPPPTSTLFPYTTLFRSVSDEDRPRNLARHRNNKTDYARPQMEGTGIAMNCKVTDPNRLTSDRKSTRLNSSHLGISYAVFCLKKKKTQQQNTTINRQKHT